MSVQERLSASIAKRVYMASYREMDAGPARQRPTALVLGTGDIASAIGRELFDLGWAVLLLRDHAVPVLRLGMAFDDALESGAAELDGVKALPAPSADVLPELLRARRGVVVGESRSRRRRRGLWRGPGRDDRCADAQIRHARRHPSPRCLHHRDWPGVRGRG